MSAYSSRRRREEGAERTARGVGSAESAVNERPVDSATLRPAREKGRDIARVKSHSHLEKQLRQNYRGALLLGHFPISFREFR